MVDRNDYTRGGIGQHYPKLAKVAKYAVPHASAYSAYSSGARFIGYLYEKKNGTI